MPKNNIMCQGQSYKFGLETWDSHSCLGLLYVRFKRPTACCNSVLSVEAAPAKYIAVVKHKTQHANRLPSFCRGRKGRKRSLMAGSHHRSIRSTTLYNAAG